MKIFVINLPEAIERKTSIIKEMNKTSLDYEFVTPERVEEVKNPKEGWTTGAKSLRRTTIKLVKKALDQGLDYIWIWEDDCIVNQSDFKDMMSVLPGMLAKNFDFIHLNHSAGIRFAMFTEDTLFRRTLDGVRNCQSYIINKGVYKDYLKYLERHEIPIDEVTKFLHRKRKKSFIVDTKPVSHKVGKYSYIRRQVVDY